MKNLRSYLVNGIPSPAKVKMTQKQKRCPVKRTDRQNRRLLRAVKRSAS